MTTAASNLSERLKNVLARLHTIESNKHRQDYKKIHYELLHIKIILLTPKLKEIDITHIENILSKIESICHSDTLFLFQKKDN